MGRPCSICGHDDRQAIDEGLVGGVPYRNLAGQFDVSLSALSRHSSGHVSPAIAALNRERERQRGESLVDRVEDLIDRADRLLQQAEESGKVAQALGAIRELRSLLELLGKASGELDDRPQVTVNLLASSEWLVLRAAILTALAPHPDARAAVAHRLGELEVGQ